MSSTCILFVESKQYIMRKFYRYTKTHYKETTKQYLFYNVKKQKKLKKTYNIGK